MAALTTLVYHQGTGTYMDISECILVHVPDELLTRLEEDEKIVSWLEDYSRTAMSGHNLMMTFASFIAPK